MPFAYYRRLNEEQRRIYRRSDEVRFIPLLPKLRPILPLGTLARALKQDDLKEAQTVCRQILDNLTAALKVPPVSVAVHAVRPRGHWGELHGLYTPGDGGKPAHVEIWMRTVRRRQVVAFRTFLRTLLHELCHHLDYELLKLPESFHTEGFYQRESSLLNQLAPKDDAGIQSPATAQKQLV
ncbi:MAG TPA: hypothetical protein VHE58_00585 [Burkholderiales bacterium]|nr:hypothetical protein [Burkholderiales bacterium]